MYREEKATKGNLTVAGHDLMKIKIKKFLIYVVKSASFSKTINYYQKKTVYENVAYAMQVIGRRPREIKNA